MTDTAPLSACTLVRNRNAMLAAMLDGFARGTTWPAEVVVAHAGGEDPRAVIDPALPFDVRIIPLDVPDERIPYSTARNATAAAATSEAIVFMDADCIPAASCVAAFADALAAEDAVCIGDVRYLPPLDEVPADEAGLRAASRRHPAREVPPADGWVRSDRYELVWGQCLGLRRATFDRLGGFADGYHGYAGEDTDLAFTARAAGVPLLLVHGADVYHQHHDTFEPPLQQFRATLENARTFHRRWGWWPMGGWLDGFADLGLIERAGDDVVVLRDPTPEEVEAARQTIARPFREIGDDG